MRIENLRELLTTPLATRSLLLTEPLAKWYFNHKWSLFTDNQKTESEKFKDIVLSTLDSFLTISLRADLLNTHPGNLAHIASQDYLEKELNNCLKIKTWFLEKFKALTPINENFSALDTDIKNKFEGFVNNLLRVELSASLNEFRTQTSPRSALSLNQNSSRNISGCPSPALFFNTVFTYTNRDDLTLVTTLEKYLTGEGHRQDILSHTFLKNKKEGQCVSDPRLLGILQEHGILDMKGGFNRSLQAAEQFTLPLAQTPQAAPVHPAVQFVRL